jgi:hypothetical protein
MLFVINRSQVHRISQLMRFEGFLFHEGLSNFMSNTFDIDTNCNIGNWEDKNVRP